MPFLFIPDYGSVKLFAYFGELGVELHQLRVNLHSLESLTEKETFASQLSHLYLYNKLRLPLEIEVDCPKPPIPAICSAPTPTAIPAIQAPPL